MFRSAFRLLLWAVLPAQADLFFDCGHAETSAEKLVCADPGPAALDRNLARFFAAVRTGPDMTDRRAQGLRADQRSWLEGRDECRRTDGLRTCVRDEYALRIAALRGFHPAPFVSENQSSSGPVAYLCDGFVPKVEATFINTDAALFTLHWDIYRAVLSQAISASGARYGGNGMVFWIKDRRPCSPFRMGGTPIAS